ncbi:MAG: hypothetical protein JO334_16535 [Verrucomicrobia bacterium]|nr:hypothetical protein [Verrucomicrobiota bacterium]
MPFSAESAATTQSPFLTKIHPRRNRRPRWLPDPGLHRVLFLGVVLTSLCPILHGKTTFGGNRTKSLPAVEDPEVASELVNVVEAFITAGEKDDPAARGKFLGPRIFYYGHPRTREQAVKAIAALYRRWPQRKFSLTGSLDLFEIPNHRGVYRATAVYDYKFDNREEHLSGKSKLTCVVEHDQRGTRIIGVDEKLLNGSTEYQQE